MGAVPIPGSRLAGAIIFLGRFENNIESFFEYRWRDVGAAMAHEVGHALGLYHLTDGPNRYDALAETPICLDHTNCTGDGFTDSPS